MKAAGRNPAAATDKGNAREDDAEGSCLDQARKDCGAMLEELKGSVARNAPSSGGMQYRRKRGEPCLRHLWEMAVAASFPT